MSRMKELNQTAAKLIELISVKKTLERKETDLRNEKNRNVNQIKECEKALSSCVGQNVPKRVFSPNKLDIVLVEFEKGEVKVDVISIESATI